MIGGRSEPRWGPTSIGTVETGAGLPTSASGRRRGRLRSAGRQPMARQLDMLAQLVEPVGEGERDRNGVDRGLDAVELAQACHSPFVAGRAPDGGLQLLQLAVPVENAPADAPAVDLR